MLLKNESSQSAYVPFAAVLRIKDAAAYLGISKGHLYKLIAREELRSINLGGRATGIRRADLDHWLTMREGGQFLASPNVVRKGATNG